MLKYRFDENGFFIRAEECYIDPLESEKQGKDVYLLPTSCTLTPPKLEAGFLPKWTGKAWKNIESHVGETGYLNGRPYTIREHGPLPKGWSTTLPEPTAEELAEQEKLKAEMKVNAQRIPDLENAAVDVAGYVAELEDRIKQLEKQVAILSA